MRLTINRPTDVAKPAKQHRIVLFRAGLIWVAQHNNPAVIAAFDGNSVLPTSFSREASAQQVCDFIQAANPNTEVVLKEGER